VAPPGLEREEETVTDPHDRGSGNSHARKPTDHPPPEPQGGLGIDALIDESLQLREGLHDAFARASRLVAALKRHRQQTKLVQGALASLRQLQRLDG
jgi:hypothetical protein